MVYRILSFHFQVKRAVAKYGFQPWTRNLCAKKVAKNRNNRQFLATLYLVYFLRFRFATGLFLLFIRRRRCLAGPVERGGDIIVRPDT